MSDEIGQVQEGGCVKCGEPQEQDRYWPPMGWSRPARWFIRFGNLKGKPAVCERCIALALGLDAEWERERR